MQCNTVMNFRARLRKRGYKDIHIKRRYVDGHEYYLIKCKEPLAEYEIKVALNLFDMFKWR